MYNKIRAERLIDMAKKQQGTIITIAGNNYKVKVRLVAESEDYGSAQTVVDGLLALLADKESVQKYADKGEG